jgi:hypothetical protein
MATDKYSNIGKDGIVKEGIFVRFPELIPACQDNYWNSSKHKKLLIVGESNYFNDDVDSVFKDPQAWYTGTDKQHLIPEEKKKDVSNYKGYKTFDRLCKSMNEVLNDTLCEHVFEEAMFYNYFLRPATVRKNNKSFKKDCTQLDREVAGIALCGIIELDKPDIVIFVSRYAHSEFKKYIELQQYELGIPFDFVNHPAHPASWHHRNGNGKQKFEILLREYWIVK